jgi:hypothetical protein
MRTFALLILIGGLSACGGSETTLAAGQWEMTTQVTNVSMPNLPAGVTPPMPPPNTVSYCLTEEQAANPDANFVTGSGRTGGCTSQDYAMRGGRISGSVQCQHQGATMRATMTGQYQRESFDMNMDMQTEMGGQRVAMQTRTTARRTGECSS